MKTVPLDQQAHQELRERKDKMVLMDSMDRQELMGSLEMLDLRDTQEERYIHTNIPPENQYALVQCIMLTALVARKYDE